MSERGSSVIPSGISKGVSIMTHNYSERRNYMVSGTDFSFTFDVLDQSTDGPSFFLLRVKGW